MKNHALFAAIAAMSLTTTGALAQNPYVMKDNTQITLSGTVTSADDNEFVLDYGGGTITVELGGLDWGFGRDGDEGEISSGDHVVVVGEVDDELFESTKIEADYVYVQDLGTQFSSPQQQAQQQQQPPPLYAATWTFVDFDTIVEGKVTSVSQEKQQFALRTGTTSTETLIVDVSNLENNPIDQDGFQQIKEGDRVAVSGDLDDNFIQNRKLIAENVVSLGSRERIEAQSTTGTQTMDTNGNTPGSTRPQTQ